MIISLENLTFIQKLEIRINYSKDKNIEINNILSTLPNSITELSICFDDCDLSSKFKFIILYNFLF